MIYETQKDWQSATHKRALVFGMSGLGKTHIANLLRNSGGWFHYSVDYRIGTRYMGEHIADNFKAHAMKVPFLANLLRSDSIYVGSNITFNNLAPLSTYLGKPGDSAKGGIAFDEYLKRQEQHRQAEIASLLDTVPFIVRAGRLYDYDNFICDSGGSICEVVDPSNPDDPVMTALADNMLLIWIEGSEDHTAELARRFDRDPKPMYYQPAFLTKAWGDYINASGQSEDKVDPDDFVRWTYARALAHRQPRYEKMAQNWGLRVCAQDIWNCKSAGDFDALIARTLAAR